MNSKMQSAPPFFGSTAWMLAQPSSSTTTSSPGAELPHDLGAEQVERAALGGEQPVVVEAPEHERTDAVGIAEADELALGEEHGREGAFDAAPSSLPPPPRAGRSSRAISAAITSVSEVEWRRTPSSTSSSRSSLVFVRLPLWPSATVRAEPCWTIGCAFAQWVEPVVE